MHTSSSRHRCTHASALGGLALASACAVFDPQIVYPREVDDNGDPIVVAYSFRHVERLASQFPGEGGHATSINLRARPTYVDGVPTIFIDRAWYHALPYEVQAFVYYHEVAHFRFGHLRGVVPPTAEQEADCYAVHALRVQENMSDRQIASVRDYLERAFNVNRAQSLVACDSGVYIEADLD